MFVSNLKNNITCPISYQIFREPVNADDGHTYEKTYLKKWLKNNSTSPITKQKIREYHLDYNKKNLVDIFLTEYPQYRCEQYLDSNIIIKCIIESSSYPEFNFDDFDFGYMEVNEIQFFFRNIRPVDLYKLIDLCEHKYSQIISNNQVDNYRDTNQESVTHSETSSGSVSDWDIDSDSESDSESDSKSDSKSSFNNFILNLIIYARPEYISYLITKNIDFNIKNNDGCNLAMYICKYSTHENLIKILEKKNIDLEYSDIYGKKIIHYACQYGLSKTIKYIIDLKVDLESESLDGYRPIHLLCIYSSPKITRYLMDKNVDLNAKTNEGWTPLHYMCDANYSFENFKYLIDRNVDLEAESTCKNRPIHIACKNTNEKAINYLINKRVNMNVFNNKNKGPIHYILKYQKDSTLVKYIINNTIDLTIKDIYGNNLYYYIKNNTEYNINYFDKKFKSQVSKNNLFMH